MLATWRPQSPRCSFASRLPVPLEDRFDVLDLLDRKVLAIAVEMGPDHDAVHHDISVTHSVPAGSRDESVGGRLDGGDALPRVDDDVFDQLAGRSGSAESRSARHRRSGSSRRNPRPGELKGFRDRRHWRSPRWRRTRWFAWHPHGKPVSWGKTTSYAALTTAEKCIGIDAPDAPDGVRTITSSSFR